MNLLRIAWSSLFAGRLLAWQVLAVLVAAVSLAVPQGVGAQQRPVPDTYLATTTNMTPDGLAIKINVLDWLDEEARAAVVAALDGEDVSETLTELPTVGYLWVDGSPVGYALKYAHRTATDAGERITVVTTPVLGHYGLEDWVPNGQSASPAYDYSVVELDVGALGSGTASLAANVVLDTEAALVTLDSDGSEPLFTGVIKEDPPYWAKEGSAE